MAYIPGELVEEVRNYYDIVDVVSSYVNLKKSGRNYVGLCPFHPDKTPSFTVSPEKQIFHCFGCQNGGNIFTFIMQVEEMSFPEAVRFLAERAGIKIDYRQGDTERKGNQVKEELLRINAAAKEYYQAALWESSGGRKVLDYLKKRGLTEQTIKEFQLGFALNTWEGLTLYLQKKGFPLELVAKAGLITKKGEGSYFDYFRNRLVFPIWDRQGQVIGFGGRIMEDGEPKYLNSPETMLFNKGKILYGFHMAIPWIRREKEAVLVEGYMDVILLHQHGIKNALAPLGTALTDKQVSLLRGRLERITLAFDADSGGQQAALRSLEILRKEGCQVRVASLPEGSDPADFLKRYGEKNFREKILKPARTVVEYRLSALKSKFNHLRSEDDRLNYWKEARKVLADLEEPVEREEYLKKIEEEIGVALEVLRGDLEKIILGSSLKNKGLPFKNKKGKGEGISEKELAERELLACLLQNPAYSKGVWKQVEPEHFTPGFHREMAICLLELEKQGKPVEIAMVLSYFSDQEKHKLIMKMAFHSRYENERDIQKTIRDCIKKIKALRWKEEREKLIKSLQGKKIGAEECATLKRISDLLKWEEELYRSGEGEDFSG